MGQKIKNQSPLTPSLTSSPAMTTKQKSKDLTDTLLTNNLNQLNLTNKTTPFLNSSINMNLQTSSYSSSSSSMVSQTYVNRMPQQQHQSSINHHTVPQNFNNLQTSTANTTSWTTPAMMLPTITMSTSNNNESKTTTTTKLSNEEIMDFLK